LALNPEFLHALDVKKCVLEIQAIILGKLAAVENHLKGFSDVPESEIAQASLAA
jgi:hypothetical protein